MDHIDLRIVFTALLVLSFPDYSLLYIINNTLGYFLFDAFIRNNLNGMKQYIASYSTHAQIEVRPSYLPSMYDEYV